jgi:hypothetical protein
MAIKGRRGPGSCGQMKKKAAWTWSLYHTRGTNYDGAGEGLRPQEESRRAKNTDANSPSGSHIWQPWPSFCQVAKIANPN